MAQIQANGITLEYESFGRAEAPAILLIMGLGAQLTLWPDSFCRMLAGAGFHVIRYDNRDVGLSTKLDEHGKPRLMRASVRFRLGFPVRATYTLDDMADDAIGLLDALKISRAHIVGASMGGMIAQILGARFADRVASLTLIMTGSGHRSVPGPSLKVGLRLVRRPKRLDRAGLIEHSMDTWKMIASPGYPVDDAERRARIAKHFDRAHHPRGLARQTMAIFASGDRSSLLSQIRLPTLIIHGRDDVLVPVAAGYDLARRVEGSTLEIIPGMGHDLPEPLVAPISASILRHIGKIDPARDGAHRRPASRASARVRDRVA